MSGLDRELGRRGTLLVMAAFVAGIAIGAVATAGLLDRSSDATVSAASADQDLSQGQSGTGVEDAVTDETATDVSALETTTLPAPETTTTTTTTSTTTTVPPPAGLASRAEIPIGAACLLYTSDAADE